MCSSENQKIIILFEPMKVFIPVTAVSFLLGLLGMIISIIQVQRLYIPNSSVILFVLGVISFLIGILSEQMAAIQVATIEKD